MCTYAQQCHTMATTCHLTTHDGMRSCQDTLRSIVHARANASSTSYCFTMCVHPATDHSRPAIPLPCGNYIMHSPDVAHDSPRQRKIHHRLTLHVPQYLLHTSPWIHQDPIHSCMQYTHLGSRERECPSTGSLAYNNTHSVLGTGHGSGQVLTRGSPLTTWQHTIACPPTTWA